jgi:tetratricopeptide (TPR) repeat protein
MGTYLNILETDYEGALRELRIAQTELKDNADILSSISLVLLREGKFAEAQEKMRRAVELDPLNAMFHSQLSDALTFTREFPEALREIDLAISIEPANMSYYYFKIEDLKAYTGDMKQIVKVYTEAIQKADSTEAFELRMRRAYDLRELSDSMALSTLSRPEIAKLKPRRRYEMSIFVYDAVNDTAMKRVYCDSMKTMLEQLLNDAPENGHLHSYLGLTLAGLGECAEAEAEGKKGMELLGPDACHW